LNPAGHILRRRHNRAALVEIPTKFLLAFSRGVGSMRARAVMNLCSFAVMFLAHFLLHPYYWEPANRVLDSVRLSLACGALCRLLQAFM
jgi:hypothetical protein